LAEQKFYKLVRGIGGMSSTQYKLVRLPDGRIPLFSTRELAYAWKEKYHSRGLHFQGPFVEEHATRLTRQHVIDPPMELGNVR